MRRPELYTAPERFHSPCESFDAWPGSELNKDSTEWSTAAVLFACEAEAAAARPLEGQTQHQLHRSNRLESRGKRTLADGSCPGEANEGQAHLHASDPVAAERPSQTLSACAAHEPSHQLGVQQRLKPSQEGEEESQAASQPLFTSACSEQQQQQQRRQSAGVRQGRDMCCPSPAKTRSISQPRSVRDLVPRLTPSRRLASLPYSLGSKGGASSIGRRVLSSPEEQQAAADQPQQPHQGKVLLNDPTDDALQKPPPHPQGNPPEAKGNAGLDVGPSKRLMCLLAIGGAFCLTLSCVAAVASLITASRLSEAPVLFLGRKAPVTVHWSQDGQTPRADASSAWKESSSNSEKTPHFKETERGETDRDSISFLSLGQHAETVDTTNALLVFSSAPRRVPIGDLRKIPLEDLAVSLGLLLQPSPEEKHLYRIEEAARNVATGETYVSLSRGRALVLKEDVGLLLSPQASVVAAWQLPSPSAEGEAVPLSPLQFSARLEAEALQAAGVRPHLAPVKEKEGLHGQGAYSQAGDEKHAARPLPSSELDFMLLDAGEPLLTGYPEPPETPQQEDLQSVGNGDDTLSENYSPEASKRDTFLHGDTPAASEGDRLSQLSEASQAAKRRSTKATF